jgi:hypothetical protein
MPDRKIAPRSSRLGDLPSGESGQIRRKFMLWPGNSPGRRVDRWPGVASTCSRHCTASPQSNGMSGIWPGKHVAEDYLALSVR